MSCVAGCTPSAAGACCRAGAVCTPNTPRSACEAAEGKYQGDGTTCPCPAPVAGDECTSAVTLTGAGGTQTFARSAITSNASDPVNTCETSTGGPFAKDGSIWFKWNSPAAGVPRLHLDLCCQGGAAGSADTLITMFQARPLNDPPGTACPAIIGAGNGGFELGCNDDGCVVGTGGADLCIEGGPAGNPGMINSRTYWILVEIFDSAATGEQTTFTLTYSSGGANCDQRVCPVCAVPVTCPGGSVLENETAQLNYCGLDYEDNWNSGCNPLSRIPPDPEAFNVSINCGQTACGTAGYYNTTGGTPTNRRRDTDWYLLALTEETLVAWTVNSQSEGAQALIVSVDDCQSVVFVDSGADLDAGNEPAPGCGGVTVSGTVPAGRYAVFASFIHPPESNDPGETIDCPQSYVGTLTCSRGDILAEPANACGGAPTITASGRYSGFFGVPVTQTPDGESSCDGVGGDTGFCDNTGVLKDVYYRYVASCTGKTAFQACSGPPMVLSAHTACPANCSTELPGGLGASCSDFGCGMGGSRPRIVLDVVQGNSYVIRLAAFMGEVGAYELEITECIEPCPAGE